MDPELKMLFTGLLAMLLLFASFISALVGALGLAKNWPTILRHTKAGSELRWHEWLNPNRLLFEPGRLDDIGLRARDGFFCGLMMVVVAAGFFVGAESLWPH